MKSSWMGLLLVGACSFGVDGDFAATEVGLVSVESLRIQSALARGYADVARVRPEGRDLVITFEVDGTEGELRFSSLRAVMNDGGHGTLRLRDVEGWSDAQPVTLWMAPGRSFGDPEVSIVFDTRAATGQTLGVLTTQSVVDESGAEEPVGSSEVDSSEVDSSEVDSSEVDSSIEAHGSFLLLLTQVYDC